MIPRNPLQGRGSRRIVPSEESPHTTVQIPAVQRDSWNRALFRPLKNTHSPVNYRQNSRQPVNTGSTQSNPPTA